ncbi:MAG: hypothetical protein JNM70_08850 [Anaerolineae bacterium]|nr:hypothetical protein [Anaerolineae bacterium]
MIRTTFLLLLLLADSISGKTHMEDLLLSNPELEIISVSNADQLVEIFATIPVEPSAINDIAWSNDGQFLGVAGSFGVLLFPLDSLENVSSLYDGSTARCIAFGRRGKLVAAGIGHTIHVWDLELVKEVAVLKHFAVTSVDFSPDESILVSGSGDGTIQIWNTTDYEIIKTLNTGIDDIAVRDIEFSPDGNLLASGFNYGLYIWDVDTVLNDNAQESIIPIISSGNTISIDFNQEGSLLAFGGWAGDANLPTRILIFGSNIKEIYILDQREYTNGVSFNMDGGILATGGDDEQIALWDVGKREKIIFLEGHSEEISALAFSPDKRILASSDFSGWIRLWGIPVKK